MPLPYFENDLSSGYLQDPNNYFRGLQQAAIDGLFDCTSAKHTIQEQDGIGSTTYHNIDVWLDYVVGTTSTGFKNGIDFTKLMFQSIDHETIQGLYYIFDDNYHLGYFTNIYDGLEKTFAVRKCNNAMKIVDPKNGAVFSIPCVIEYDMTSPSQQVTSYVITPNNHASVMVQGNEDTLRLFKLNTRYIFNGRPFKLLAYQNALYYDLNHQYPTLLYLDLYLDEIHDKDDIENSVAYNGEYDYSIQIDSDDMQLTNGSTGTLTATVLLNGDEAQADVMWASSDTTVVTIDNTGVYSVVGSSGTSATITAFIQGNPDISSSITIQVVEQESVQPVIILNPAFTQIRQYESIAFGIEAVYGSQVISAPTQVQISLSESTNVLSNQYLTITQSGSQYTILANGYTSTPQILYVAVQNDTPNFQVSQQFSLNIVNMFG